MPYTTIEPELEVNPSSVARRYLQERQQLLDDMILLDTKYEVSCRITTGELGEGIVILVPYQSIYGIGGGSKQYVRRRVWRINDILAISATGDLFIQYNSGEWDTYRVLHRLQNVVATTKHIRTFLDTPKESK
jgi:hypothetical protein